MKMDNDLYARFDRLDMKLDKTLEHVASIDVTLAGQAAQLAEHMRRSASNERRVEQVEADAKQRDDSIAADVRPIKDHVQRLKGAAWLIGILIAGFEALRLIFS